MKRSLLISKQALIVFFCLFISICEAQQIDCSQTNNVIAINQQIREKTYQYVKLANSKEYNVNKDSLLNLFKDYVDIQTNFNKLYTQMKIDKGNFASKKLICSRYSETLTTLIARANAYDDRILRLVSPDTQSSNFGVSDVLDIIDWLFKKFKDKNTQFYDAVKWDDWKTIAGS